MKAGVKLGAAVTILAWAAGARAAEKVPLYLYAAPTPFRTVEAQNDAAYTPGDLAVVAGRWQKGGRDGGVLIQCSVKEPSPGKKGLLAEAPFDARYFYLDVPAPDTPADGPGDWVWARGLVADVGLYAYGYVVRPEMTESLAPPALDAPGIREALKELRPRIKRIKLDAITSAPHRPYNKGYRINADGARAELTVENEDFKRGLTVVRARVERLPPENSDVLFRYLDVYLVADAMTAEIKWAVACVGGFALE